MAKKWDIKHRVDVNIEKGNTHCLVISQPEDNNYSLKDSSIWRENIYKYLPIICIIHSLFNKDKGSLSLK